jgi:hypothetical protein
MRDYGMQPDEVVRIKKGYYNTASLYKIFGAWRSPASALAWGARGRRFKSSRPDHRLLAYYNYRCKQSAFNKSNYIDFKRKANIKIFLEKLMKNSNFFVFFAILLTLSTSIACSLFVPTVQPTGAPEPDFGPTGGPLKFSPDTLPDAQVGKAYDSEIRISLNSTPAGDIYVSNGALPTGLELVKVDGEDIAQINGTPSEAGTFSFTVSVWCYGTQVSGQTGEKDYTIVVKP